MALFTRMTQRIWQYVSPDKPNAEPRSKQTTKTTSSASALAALQRRASMSPVSRVATWQLYSPTTPHVNQRTGNCDQKRKRTSSVASDRKVKRGRGQPRKKSTSTKPSVKRPRGRPRKSLDSKQAISPDTMGRVDGDVTLVDDLSSLMSEIEVAPSPSRSRSPHGKNASDSPQSWSPQRALEDTLIDTAPETPHAKASSALPTSVTPGAQLPVRDLAAFPIAAQPLIHHLLMRGRESLFPCTWRFDFKFLPSSLFFPSPLDQAIIGSLSGSDFRAQKSFDELLGLGAKIRDKILVKLPPEGVAVKTIENYVLWALKDSALITDNELKCPEVLICAAGHQAMDVAVLQHILVEKMDNQEGRWNAWLGGTGPLPYLYGVVVSHSMVAFVGYESDGLFVRDKEARLRKIKGGMQTLGMFDFGQKTLDVWNALALALLALHVRDVMRGYAA